MYYRATWTLWVWFWGCRVRAWRFGETWPEDSVHVEPQCPEEAQSANVALKAQLPIYWVPVLKSLYNFILSGTKGPTIWVPGLLGWG